MIGVFALAMNIKQLTSILYVVLIALIMLVVVVGLILYWYLKVRRPSSAKLEDVDYSGLNRADTIDFMKFDDITDDMIITKNGTEFHGVIQCQGFDYYSAHGSERKRAHDGYLSFINLWEDGITYRQFTKKVNLDDTINSYKEAYNRVEQELYNASQDFDIIQENYLAEIEKAKEAGGELDKELELAYVNELMQLNNLMKNLDWQRYHIGDNIAYVEEVTSRTSPDRIETYCFKWKYEPLLGRELSDSKIHKKAKRELNRKAQAYINALSNAGVTAVRVDTKGLIQMKRSHWHPYTADRYREYEVEMSNFEWPIVTGNALIDEDYEYAQENGLLDKVFEGQEKLKASGREEDSLPLDRLLDLADGRLDDNAKLSNEELIKTKAMITNEFKEREEKRKEALLDEQERKQKEAQNRKKKAERKDDSYISNDIDFSSLRFSIDDN